MYGVRMLHAPDSRASRRNLFFVFFFLRRFIPTNRWLSTFDGDGSLDCHMRPLDRRCPFRHHQALVQAVFCRRIPGLLGIDWNIGNRRVSLRIMKVVRADVNVVRKLAADLGIETCLI